MLCDASPLIALADEKQAAHERCTVVLGTLSSNLVTTWPCFTEAMYLLYTFGGYPLQRLLWGYVERGALRFYALTETDAVWMQALMAQYRDMPMDLADASLVAAAEALRLTSIFTLDSDFYVYRVNGKT
jgi:predicted nucleic acid-binding protein